jgi:hypothetical protein
MDERFGGSRTRRYGGVRRLTGTGLPFPRDYSWFHHPEMQARIARAEADLREGRFFTANSMSEMQAYLNAPRQALT